MTKDEHMMITAAEECGEVAQRITKALRFGLEEIQPGQDLTNAERIQYEFADLLGMYEEMMDAGLVKWPERYQIDAKKEKYERFLERSREYGSLEDE